MKAENPKDKIGAAKPPLDAIPPVAILELGQGMNNGREKYGLMNYRDHKTLASVYYNAAMRHLLAWWDGEDMAEDSSVHHLGHAMACMAIILDAIHLGNFEDDRPKPGPFQKRVDDLSRPRIVKQDSTSPKVVSLRRCIMAAYGSAVNAHEHLAKVSGDQRQFSEYAWDWLQGNGVTRREGENIRAVVDRVACPDGELAVRFLKWLESDDVRFGLFGAVSAEAREHRVETIAQAYKRACEALRVNGHNFASAKTREWLRLHGFEPEGSQCMSTPDVLSRLAREDFRAYKAVLDWLESLPKPDSTTG